MTTTLYIYIRIRHKTTQFLDTVKLNNLDVYYYQKLMA